MSKEEPSVERNISPAHIDLYMCNYGNQECPPDFSWGPGVKNQYKVHYIFRGRGELSVRGALFPVETNQGFLICPNELVYYKADHRDPWHYAWIAFDGLNAERYLKRASLSIENPVFTMREPADMIQFFKQLFAVDETISDLTTLKLDKKVQIAEFEAARVLFAR